MYLYKQLVKELNLDLNCDFIDHLPVPDLHAYFSIENAIVLDQFGELGMYSLGGTSRESLALGSLLVTSTDIRSKKFIERTGPDCPLFYAFTADEIFNSLMEIDRMGEEEKLKRKEAGIEWMRKHYHWEPLIDRVIRELEGAIAEANR